MSELPERHGLKAEVTFADIPFDSSEAFATDWICRGRPHRTTLVKEVTM